MSDLGRGKRRNLLWIDGANSAVMGYFVLQEYPDAEPVHCNLGKSVHPDNHRIPKDQKPILWRAA